MIQLENGYPFDSQLFSSSGALPLVRIRDLTTSEFATFISGPVSGRVVLQNDDIVVGMDGDFNVVRWARGPAALNQRLCRLRPNEGVDLRFVLYALPTPLRWINETQYATTVKHLSSGDLLGARLPLPPLDEQRRIANFLDEQVARIETIVALRVAQVGLIDSLTIAHADEMLRVTDAPIRRLGNLLALGAVGVVVNPSTYFVDDGVPFIHGYNVRDGYFDLSDLKRMSLANSALLSRSQLRAGDVLVVRAGYPGRAAVVTDTLAGGNCASVLLLRPGPELDPHWLEAFFNSALGKSQVELVQYGAAQGVINLGEVRSFAVPLPPVNDQRDLLVPLHEFRSSATRMRKLLEISIARMAELKQSLITAATTGAFDVASADGTQVAV